jgi:hypothetical protein
VKGKSSEEESKEEVFLTTEPLVKKRTQEEMEKVFGNLKTNKAISLGHHQPIILQISEYI